jgi:hypothetical protein
MKKLLLAGIAALSIPSAAHAATFDSWSYDPDRYIVEISGEILLGDNIKFRDTLIPIVKQHDGKDDITIVLDSKGGDLRVALAIGTVINGMGYSTFVVSNTTCVLACALIWLGGKPRLVGSKAHIGFHSAYNATTDEVSGGANALVGMYLSRLGLSARAVYYLTNTPPDQIEWLTMAKAKEYGIVV